MSAHLAAFLATLATLAAFVFCVIASLSIGWHPAITGPATPACAIALIACTVWLNRSAS